MELLHFITKLLDIEDTNIKIIDVINRVTHKEIITKLEATNNLIKLIKRNAFAFRNFENFKKRIFITLNIKKERTKLVLSLAYLFFNPLQLTKSPILPRLSQPYKRLLSQTPVMNREDRIRTCDTLVPNQVLYQAELLPELKRKMHPRGVEPLTA